MLIDILPTVILRCGHLPPVSRALASLAAGVGSDAGADAAQRVDGHAEEVGHIAQLDAVGKAGEAGEEHAVALGGRQLEAVLPRPRGVMAVSRRPRPTCPCRRAAAVQTSHDCHGG